MQTERWKNEIEEKLSWKDWVSDWGLSMSCVNHDFKFQKNSVLSKDSILPHLSSQGHNFLVGGVLSDSVYSEVAKCYDFRDEIPDGRLKLKYPFAAIFDPNNG